jgi:putative transposase
MRKSRLTEAQIMGVLRQVEGGMDASMIDDMKVMEDETRRLKKMFAELSMQNELLKEALGKKYPGQLSPGRRMPSFAERAGVVNWPKML